MTMLSNMPTHLREEDEPVLILGSSIEQVTIQKLIQLLIDAKNKVNIIFDEIVLEKVMARDDVFIELITNPKQMQSKAEEEQGHAKF